MGTFRSNKLGEILKQDLKKNGTSDRFPVRFCFANLDKNLYSDFLSLNNNKNFNSFYYYEISKILNDKNLWILWHNAYNKIYNDIFLNDNNFVVFGLSELLRFTTKSELETIITQLNGLENISNNNKKRIIFVFDSLFNEIKEILKNTNQRSDFFNPIIDLTNNNEVKNFEYPELIISLENNSILKTVKDYLDCQIKFSTYNTLKLTCASSVIQSLVNDYGDFLNDKDFKYINLSNPEKIISENFEIPINDIKKINKNLLIKLSKLIVEFRIDNIDMLMEQYLKHKFNENDLLEYLFLEENNDLFFLSLFYIIINRNKNLKFSYLYKLIKNLTDYSSIYQDKSWLIENIILYYSSDDILVNFSSIREEFINFLLNKKLIKHDYLFNETKYESIFENFLTNYVKNKFPWINLTTFSNKIKLNNNFKNELIDNNKSNQLSDLKHKLYEIFKSIITGKLDIEKEIIIKLYSIDFLDLNFIKEKYEDLYFYLDSSHSSNENDNKKMSSYIQKYFSEYKISKTKNEVSEFLNNYYSELNVENFFENLNEINDIRKTNQEINPAYILVLDGIGAEYYDFLISKISKKYHKMPVFNSIRKSSLPSITSVNKQFIYKLFDENNILRIDKFDSEIIHGNIYTWPKNLIKSLNLISEIVEENIKNCLKSEFLIIADHGSTIAPILFKHQKINNFVEAEHDGRCMKIKNQSYSNAIDKGYIVYNDYLISINYMSLNNRPTHESHGGATFEEMLVPYLYYSPININYSVTFDKDTINGLNKNIVFRISPDISLNKVNVYDYKDRLVVIEKDNGQFIGTLIEGISQQITINICGKKYKKNIKNNSFITNEEGDLF